MSRKSVLSVFFVVCAACLGLYLSRGPWVAYREQKLKADIATKEMLKAESEKTDLMKQKAMLESPIGRETLARQHNYIKNGEQPLNSSGSND